MNRKREVSGNGRTLFLAVSSAGLYAVLSLASIWEMGSSQIDGGEAALSVDVYGGFILVFFSIALSGLVGLFCMTFFNSGIGQGRSREYKPARVPVPIPQARRSAYEEWRRF